MQNLYETLALFLSKSDRSHLNDAVNFIHQIKAKFVNNPDEFDAFRKTLLGITAARLSSDGDSVTLHEIQKTDVERMKAKLHGHRDLLAALETYLPPKYDDGKKEDQKKTRKNIFQDVSVRESESDKPRKRLQTETCNFLRKARNKSLESEYMNVLKSLRRNSTVKGMEKQGNIPDFSEDLKKYKKLCETIVSEHKTQQQKDTRIYERIVAESSPSSSLKYRYKCEASKSDHSGKHKISKKEEVADNIEDDQLQADLLIEWFKSAIIYAEFLLEKYQIEENLGKKQIGEEAQLNLVREETGEEEQLRKEVNEHNVKIFETNFTRCLEEMDKDHIMKDSYLENPQKALPVILRQFQVKLKGFQASKEQLDRTCKEAYEKHYS